MEPAIDIKIENDTIYIAGVCLQDPQAAAILAEYPPARRTEMVRRALKIGLSYLRGGAD